MAKFLEESHLRNVFRERYLRIHDSCLKSISDLLATAYGRDHSADRNLRSAKMIKILCKFKDPGIALKDSEDAESSYFRNLRNAWYHEFAMRNTNMQIAAWKIIQTYYSVYCSVSAIVRCFKLQGLRGHRPMLIEYGDSVVSNLRLKNSLLPPTNLFLDRRLQGSDRIEWKYGLTNHVPNIEMGLQWA